MGLPGSPEWTAAGRLVASIPRLPRPFARILLEVVFAVHDPFLVYSSPSSAFFSVNHCLKNFCAIIQTNVRNNWCIPCVLQSSLPPLVVALAFGRAPFLPERGVWVGYHGSSIRVLRRKPCRMCCQIVNRNCG